jgi:hypothetical protein
MDKDEKLRDGGSNPDEGGRVRIFKTVAGFGAIGAVIAGFALPAGASCPPPAFTTQTTTPDCNSASSPLGPEPVTLTTTVRQISFGPTSTYVGRATVSGGPNGKTLSFALDYKETPPSPTEPPTDPTYYSGWVVIGNAEIVGYGPLYLEGGTAGTNHYGGAYVTSGRSLDLCTALGYPSLA